MEQFVRKRLTFLASFWNKLRPRSVPDNCSLGYFGPDPVSLQPDQDPDPALPASPLFVALYDFTARSTNELSVSRGDKLCVYKDVGEYVLARRLSGDSVGYVPANYVAKISQETPSHQLWYFSGISRHEAERLLLSPPNEHGSFLIRDSESSKGEYSLSVRNQAKVSHFRICKCPDGGLYIQKGHTFPSMEELLAFYMENWKAIQSPLVKPCVLKTLPERDEWERPRSEFTLRKKLGEGNFGEVWEGLWRNTVPVAIKIIKQADMKAEDFTKEIQNLKSLKHEKLIQLHAVCSRGEPVFIITELMKKGNLQSYLNSLEGKSLSTLHLLDMACQVADGMTYLEEKHIVHRDLAARNILVGDDLTCKIADFGLARLLKDDIYSTSGSTKIPVKWTAPEAANYRTYSLKSDIWSYGILLYEVFTYGQTPYEGMTNQETIQQITRGYRLPRPSTCPSEIYLVMLECWKGNAEDRPTFFALREKLNSIYSRVYKLFS
ncbi:tyrosine-protein kinase Srms [Alligator mississippiensis]|uniref:Tyrosine-protein kinase n=2 Tax=Alligator mississippiensis TaxID=8496 RepID=A0A151N008_ALLMI|nr:tyrosine-protein kinase Srms [Alligator mississippiensis]